MLSRQDAKHAKKDSLSFRPRGVMGRNSTGEKSFLDPSHSLGMTDLAPSPWRPLRSLREIQFFPISSSSQNFKARV